MGWVIWRDNDERGRREYVRRITPNFVSFTIESGDARKWQTRAEAQAALKGTGLTTYRVRKAPDDAPAADEPADDGPPFT
jgi:hypothetical protein